MSEQAAAAPDGGAVEGGGEASVNPLDSVRDTLAGMFAEGRGVENAPIAEETPHEPAEEPVEGDEPPAEGEEAPEAEEATDRHTLKVDGEEREVSTEELVRLAQKNAAADKALEQAKATQRELQAYKADVEKLMGDPLIGAYLKDGKAGLYREVEQLLTYETLPEQERKQLDERRELERKAAEADRLKAEQNKTREAQLAQQYTEQLEQEMSAIVEMAGVSPNAAHLRRAAGLLEEALHLQQQGTRVTREQIAKVLRDEAHGEFTERLGSIEPEALAELLGEDGVKRFRQWDAQRIRGAQPQVQRGDPEAQRQRRQQQDGTPQRRKRASEVLTEWRQGKL